MELTSSISLFSWLNSRVTAERGGYTTHQTAIFPVYTTWNLSALFFKKCYGKALAVWEINSIEYISSQALSIQRVLKVTIIYLYLLPISC